MPYLVSLRLIMYRQEAKGIEGKALTGHLKVLFAFFLQHYGSTSFSFPSVHRFSIPLDGLLFKTLTSALWWPTSSNVSRSHKHCECMKTDAKGKFCIFSQHNAAAKPSTTLTIQDLYIRSTTVFHPASLTVFSNN